MKDRKRLDGWGEIALLLTEAAGVPISVDQAKRYARNHGMPVKRIGPGERKRVTADVAALVEWCVKAFG